MKKKLILIFTLVLIIPIIANAQSTKATDLIKNKANNANLNNGSIAALPGLDLSYDNSVDKNLRYITQNPKNYIYFNDELWRIVGVMNNIDNGKGVKTTNLKIVRDTSIGKYQWSTNGNTWQTASLMKMLNPGYENEPGGSIYWNAKSGTCNGSETCNFTSTGIKSNYRNMVATAVWYNPRLFSAIGNSRPGAVYSLERDSLENRWTGKIALVYPSDIGFSTSGGSSKTREACLDSLMYSWNTPEYSDCNENNIFKEYRLRGNYATLASEGTNLYVALSNGSFSGVDTYPTNKYDIYPTLYLNSDVRIYRGTGTKTDPYIITPSSFEVEDPEENIEIDEDEYLEETTVEFSVKDKEGYSVDTVTITTANGSEIEYSKDKKTYSFVMPSSKVTINVTYKKNIIPQIIIDHFENPETADKIFISLTILVIAGFIGTQLYTRISKINKYDNN